MTPAAVALALLVGLPPIPPDDPFPIRRVNVARPPATPGGLRQMSQSDFDALLRAANAGPPPRIVAATYTAKLTDSGLTGTGEWRVAAPAAGVITLDPLRVALANPRWADGPALVYRAAGGAAALWAAAGDRTLAFDWSARGAEEPGDLRFDLRLPAAPVAVLDLDLPADRTPALGPADGLLTGPFPAAAGRAGWRLAFGGESRVELSVRAPGRTGQLPPLARATRTARFDFAPGQAVVAFEFEFESLRGPAAAWEFDVDPRLTVLDATATGRESWQLTPNADAAKPGRLTLRLRDPAAGGRVTVLATAAFPAGGEAWPCPLVTPAAVLADETVELRFAGDLTPGGWDAADYRTTAAGPMLDRGVAVTLKGSLVAVAGPRRAPVVRATAAVPAVASVEAVEWTVTPERSRLAGRFRLTAVRGPVDKISFRVPTGYTPDPPQLTPDDPAADWSTGPAGTWVLTPARPLATGQILDVTVSLRGPPGPPVADPASVVGARRTLPFPAFGPVTTARDGTFTITVTGCRGWPSPPPPDGAAYKYAGGGPAGTLVLAPRRPAVSISGDTAVSPDGAAVTRLRPAGDPGPLTVFAPGSGSWTVEAVNATVAEVPAGPSIPWLPVLGGGWAAVPVATAGRFFAVAPGRGDIALSFTARGYGSTVPVPVVLGADQPAWPVAAGSAPGGGWSITAAKVEYVVADAAVTGVLTCLVASAAAATLPVNLPAGAEIEWATAGGKWTTAGSVGGRALIPIPRPGPGGVAVELRFRLPPPTGPTATVALPLPVLPNDTAVARTITAAGGYRVWPTLGSTAPDAAEVRVIRPAAVAAAGWAVAAVVAAAGLVWLAAGRPRRIAVAVVVLLAAVGGIVALLSPAGWAPVVAAPLAAALVAVPLAAALRRRALVVAVAACGTATAQAPEPPTVYVTPDKFVFAPPDVLARLTALAPAPPAVAVTAMTLAGREGDAAATFDATFVVHVTRPGEYAVALPLTGVRLEAMALDGSPAFPDAGKPEQFTVTVRGVGPHTLTARFAVPVASAGADREVRFGVPDVPAGRLTFAAGPGSRQFAVPTRRGDQAADRAGVRADLGGGKTVAVRWRRGGAGAATQQLSATELAVWDLSETDPGVTWAAALRAEPGATTRLRVAVPPGLEPGRVTVRAADPGPLPAAANGVRDWSLEPAADGWRTLVIGLQNPLDGRAVVACRFVPAGPLSLKPVLAFPRLVTVPAQDSFCLVRLAGVVADGWAKENVIDFPADLAVREFAGVPDLGLDRRPASRAFRREGTGLPRVTPSLRSPADPAPTGHDTTYTVGPRADAEGTVRWAKDVTASTVAFDVPDAVAVADVRGTDVAGWVRTGPRVRVWFRTAVKEPVVRWTGSLPAYPATPADGLFLDLPAGAAKVKATDGWAVVGTPPRVQVFPPLDRPTSLTTTVTPAGVRTEIDIALRANRPHRFTVRVAAAGAKIDLPPGATATEVPVPNGSAWAVATAADFGTTLRATVTTGPVTGEVPAVDVLIAGVPSGRATRRLTIVDPRMKAVPVGEGVKLVPAAAAAPTVPNAVPTARTADGVSTPPAAAAAAGLWLLGFAAAATLLLLGRRRGWPEALVAFGLVAAIAAGPALLGVAAIGTLLRLGRLTRRAARAALR